MGVGADLYMCDVVKKFTFAISSPDEFLFKMAAIRHLGFLKLEFLTVIRFRGSVCVIV